ncbi:dynein-related subfamily AAA family protein [Ureibacillus xyleni]|uniref:Dynein-related subfamily AAA family protein n=1 Tax=Ureibacillus xyleni TaxID=614648 RepID=A0A285RY08_9BACL|nr:AAA family ATPase [Ureibacillus xyleni]SOB99490.1 dynein-related subfamily AAA family protein [Ureibacillus xyleni]
MSQKIWDTFLIGVLDTPQYDYFSTWDSVFINKQNSLQFNVKIISRPPDSFPNVKTVTCFNSDLEPWGFEDDYIASDEVRKEDLKNWLDDKLLVFKVERRVRYNHEEVFNAKDVQVIPKLPSFHNELSLIPVPIFSEQSHNFDFDEFLQRLVSKKFIGRIDGISHESDDTPSFILWKETYDDDDHYKLFGEFEKHQYAFGGFSFELSSELKGVEFSTAWLEECYFINGVEDIIFIPLSIYQEISDVMKDSKELPETLTVEKSSVEDSDKKLIEHEPVTIHVESSSVSHELQMNETSSEQLEELEFLESFYTQTKETRLCYTREDLINFHTAMKSSTLVILSGMSGTGKSKLVDSYSQALGLKGEQYTVIPVNPSWTSDSDLIGYADTMHMVYRPGDSGLINALKKAESHPDKLFLICFDEMNLARVEHYFSQFLSILEMEQGKRILRLYNDDLENRLYNSAQYPPTILIQDNVLFVGTVNIDESTYHFSDKVLDRSNVINLEVLPFTYLKDVTDKKKHNREEVKYETYKSFKNDNRVISLSDVELELLWELHQLLHKANRQVGVGPRIVRQIDQYLENLPVQQFITRKDGLDRQIVQRVLTKVRGSDEQLREVLGTYIQEGEIINSRLLNLLGKYDALSSFTKSKEIIEQKAKELKLYGYSY